MRSLYVLSAASLLSLAWAGLTSRWEWSLLSLFSLALAAAWGREGGDPGTAVSFVMVPLLALPALDLVGLGEDILSPLALVAGVAVLYFTCLPFTLLLSRRTAFRADPPGLLLVALLAAVAVSTFFQLGAYYADLLLGASLVASNSDLMWPLFFNLGGSLLLTASLAWSEPALRLLRLPEAG